MLLGDAAILFSLLARTSRYGFLQKRRIPDTCVSPHPFLPPGTVKRQPVSLALLSSAYMLPHYSYGKDTKTFHFVMPLYRFEYQYSKPLRVYFLLFRVDRQPRFSPYALSVERFINGDIFLHRYSTAYKLNIRDFASSLCCFDSLPGHPHWQANLPEHRYGPWMRRRAGKRKNLQG
jgi:hypothetical protein